MTAWEMIDLHGILTLASAYPSAFAPETFEGLASLTMSKVAGAENFYRKVMQAWPLKLDKGIEYPRWLTVDNDYCTSLSICLTEKESDLLRSILLTCARLRREDRLMELAGLAEATEQFPMMIALQRRDTWRHVQKELRRFCKLHRVELLSAPPEDEVAWSAAYKGIKQRAARNKKAGGTTMTLHDRITDILAAAVENRECAGINVLVRRYGEEVLYTQAGMADIAEGRLIQRDSIFRLYSQSKPVTAAAVMLLVERGLIDLMDGVDRYLPGFRNAQVVDAQGNLTKAYRAPWIMELMGMTAGLCYPDGDPAGQYAARVFEDAHEQIKAGGGIPTVEFMNRLGEQPLAFQPGTHWRYSTCADALGAVVEVVSGQRFGDFLREELFIPLEMEDTAFWVPKEKQERFVTCYERGEEGLTPWTKLHLAVGDYSRDPAFESGGAGLVSTLEDYSHFADMMMNGGVWKGRRILSPASVKFLTTPQLSDDVRKDMWDSLAGYSYGKLCRVCVEPERVAGLALKDEYGWDGWLGTYLCNFPGEGITLLSMQNTTNCGTSAAVRKVRNALLAALSRGEI